MKKYNDPRFEISTFDKESIITVSGETYTEWAEKNNVDTIELEFSKFVNMGE